MIAEKEPVPEVALPYSALAYGCHWRSAFPLSLFQSVASGPHGPDVSVLSGDVPAPPRPFHLANARLRFAEDGLRYLADDGGILDVFGTDQIVATPAPGWHGSLPAAFYGTATAALLALRGHLPIHGSSVALGGKAVLICGHPGAGKSTLTAAMVAAGGLLISDDLSIVQAGPEGGMPLLRAGRRAIRLFSDVAGMLEAAVPVERLETELARKVLAAPPAADPAKAYPLAAILMLSAVPLPVSSPGAAALLLSEYGYRRRAFRRLLGHTARTEMARSVAETVPAFALPPVEARDAASLRRAAEDVFRVCADSLSA